MPVYVVRSLSLGTDPRPLAIEQLTAPGRREAVRGLTFTNLAPRSLKDIVAMGRVPHIYNYLGQRPPADGGAPATIITPSIILTDVDVRPDDRSHPPPPLYPTPLTASPLTSR